jgi:carbamoyl-phosphate synthase small subunit
MAKIFSTERKAAQLVLADGTVFRGVSIGAEQSVCAEVVFNTAMCGYQEILTDPSYTQQIVTMTYPHIGNVGINADDIESDRVAVSGLIIRELSPIVSNWRAQQSLTDYLKAHQIVALAGVDTRRLTRHLRDHGAQAGCIALGDDTAAALAQAQATVSLQGLNLASEVSTAANYSWQTPSWPHGEDEVAAGGHVVVFDFGVKQQILRLLVDRGLQVTVVPADTPTSAVLQLQPDGVLLSNGPGDPAACESAIVAATECIAADIPVLGICLGFQILALAAGAKTEKMKFGHHGANHPVRDCDTGQVFITSQNHGFCVTAESMPADLRISHVSLFDGTVQGFAHRTKPVLGFQGHPEASPGPREIQVLFDRFVEMVNSKRRAHAETN